MLGEDPDAWWNGLPLERRKQICRWITQPVRPGQVDGQEDLADLLPDLPRPEEHR